MFSLSSGPMSPAINRLPPEVLKSVLLYLTARDVRSCRLLYRRLKDIIDSNRILLTAELDAAGYIESSNPRTDLDTMGKYKHLHLHQTRQKSHTTSSMETFKLGVLNGGFQYRFHSLTDNHAPKLKGGTLTKWSSINPNSYLPLQLDVVQLASLNLGAESKQWKLAYEDMNIKDYDVEPACDLLVLLEYLGPALDPFNPNVFPPTFDVTGLDGGTPKAFVFHFRTLSTNESHPSAVKPLLDCGIITGNAFGFWVTCLGDIIVSRPKCTPSRDPSSDSCSGLIMYNWTTGALLDRKDELYTNHLKVLSAQVLVMPRSSFTYGSQNALMGQLDLYYIDWSDSSNPTMTYVAILELPFVHSIPPIPAEHQSQLTPAHVAMHITCHSESIFSSSRPVPHARGPERIFEPIKRNQLLRIHIRLPWVESAFYPGVPGKNRLSNDTSIYVPYHTVFSAVESGTKKESGAERVHWEDWASSARWVHLDAEFWEVQPRAASGTRCILTRHSMEHYTTNWQDPNKRHTYDVYILDFNPMFVDELANRDDEERKNEHGSEKWVYQPAEPDNFSPVMANVERRTWLAECGAEKAAAPYAWSKFKHAYFDDIVAQLQNAQVMFDDEHIVVIEGQRVTGQMSKIVVFNF